MTGPSQLLFRFTRTLKQSLINAFERSSTLASNTSLRKSPSKVGLNQVSTAESIRGEVDFAVRYSLDADGEPCIDDINSPRNPGPFLPCGLPLGSRCAKVFRDFLGSRLPT